MNEVLHGYQPRQSAKGSMSPPRDHGGLVLHPTQDVVQNPSGLQPFAIVAIGSPVDDRRYSLAEEAKQEALRLSEEKGYTYTVVQVLGEARCHKSSEWVGD